MRWKSPKKRCLVRRAVVSHDKPVIVQRGCATLHSLSWTKRGKEKSFLRDSPPYPGSCLAYGTNIPLSPTQLHFLPHTGHGTGHGSYYTESGLMEK